MNDPRIGTSNRAPTRCALSGQEIRPDSVTIRYHLRGEFYYRVLAKYAIRVTALLHEELLTIVSGSSEHEEIVEAQDAPGARKKSEKSG